MVARSTPSPYGGAESIQVHLTPLWLVSDGSDRSRGGVIRAGGQSSSRQLGSVPTSEKVQHTDGNHMKKEAQKEPLDGAATPLLRHGDAYDGSRHVENQLHGISKIIPQPSKDSPRSTFRFVRNGCLTFAVIFTVELIQ